MNNIIPLKIPSGWAIINNNCFNDEPMIVDNGIIQNDISFREDILSIAQVIYSDKKYIIPKLGYWLDLGWYPEGDPNGTYRLILFKKDWNNILIDYRTIEKPKITFAINQILAKCTNLSKEKEDIVIAKLLMFLK